MLQVRFSILVRVACLLLLIAPATLLHHVHLLAVGALLLAKANHCSQRQNSTGKEQTGKEQGQSVHVARAAPFACVLAAGGYRLLRLQSHACSDPALV